MAIINYYEKYGISQTDELEKIQWVISQKIVDEENDSFGEGHSDRMFILHLAKEAFATTKSKAKYDQDLADSMKKSDPEGERKASLEKWYADAKNYYANKQYDLAKTAIDRAMQYATPQTVGSAFYDTAANIYSVLKLYSQALELHNQSIVLSPDNANGYYLKSITLYNHIFEKNLGNDRMQDVWEQLKATCDLAIAKVTAQGHDYNQASKCYEFLAEMHYVYAAIGYGGGEQFPITGNNNALAEEYALKAFSVLNAPHSDSCPTAKKILDDISDRRKQIAELEQINNKLEQENSSLRETISTQESSINDATTYGSTKFGKEAMVGGIAGLIGLITVNAGGVFFIIIAIAIFAIKGGIIAHNIKVRDTLENIRENESKINKNAYQINQNADVITQQKAGLAPRPIVNVSASLK